MFAFTGVSFAQTAGDATQNFGLDSEFSQVAIQSDRDLKSVITAVVNITLGFLGIVAVVIIIYAGYLWMTASGNEEQVTRAKSILRNAVIGLVIIMASWAIAAFVINRIGGAIGTGGDGDGGGGGFPPPGPNVAAFVVDSFETSHDGADASLGVQLCSSIQAQFNHWLNAEMVENLKNGDTLTIKRNNGGAFVDEGTILIEKRNNVISFKRIDGQSVDAKGRPVRVDWTPNAEYEVRLDETLRDARGLVLSGCADCGGTRDGYHYWTFTTGTTRDSVAPSLAVAYPGNGDANVPRSTLFSLEFSESIDATTVLAPPAGASEGDPDELVVANIFLEPRLADGTYGQAIPSSAFDASFKNSRLVFDLNASHVAAFDGRPYLEPYTEYRLTIQNIEDLCGNELAPPVEIVFTTGADVPGVSFVRPSDRFGFACPATPVFAQFRTSMYNVRTQSCGVDTNGNAGLVLAGSLNPAGVGLRSIPEDNFSGTGNLNDFCRQYSFNLDSNDAADDLIPGTAYSASISFIEPGQDVADSQSHAWSFTAAEASACAQEPYISYISSGLGRNRGQWEQCLTVQGRYFGSAKTGASSSHTSLSLDSPLNVSGLTSAISAAWQDHAGLAISDRAWSDASIAGDFIGPPSEPIPVQANVDFDIAVSVDHGGSIGALASNAVRFTVDTTRTFTGPCLYSINPASGFWGDSVTLSGSNLGVPQGSELAFYNQKTALPASWTNTRIQSRVPNQAQNNPADGEVFVTVSGVQSNKLEFNLAAGVGQSCSAIPNSCSPDPGLCSAGLECRASSCTCQVPNTFRVTSVQPAAGCTDSCTAAVLSFETNMPMGDISGMMSSGDNRIQLKKCAGASRCSWDDPAAAPVVLAKIPDGVQRFTFMPHPPGVALAADAWYIARVLGGASGVRSDDGKTIANLNADTIAPPGEDAYAWSFKTGSQACAINRIELNQSSIGLFEGESADLAIRAYGPSNSCARGGQELVPPDNFAWRACAYGTGDVSFECRQSCAAPLLGGNAIASVSASSSGQSTVTGQKGSADGSVKALACGFYDQGSTHLSDGATATVYAACSTNEDCTRNGQCAGSACLQTGANAGRCSPTITNFNPESGVAGTWVTINGCYFGNTRQRVDIGADPGGQPAQAVAPSAAWCGTTWSDSNIIAEVAPNAINSGPVRVTRSGFDPASFGSYNPDGASHPGICRLTPFQARPNDSAAIRGQGFGAAPGSVVFTVGSAPFPTTDVVARPSRSNCPEDGWENRELCIRVAEAPAGSGTVVVMRGTDSSNAVSFRVLGAISPGLGNPNNLAVRSYAPGDGNYACLNMIVEVVLRGEATQESLGFAPGGRLDSTGANFYVRRTGDNSVVAGVADAITRGSQTTLRLYPDQGELSVRASAPPPDYQIILKGGISGLRSTTGGILAADAVCDALSGADIAAGLTEDDCVINFDTVNNSQDDQCRLTHFEIEPVAPIFTCAGRDNCEGDAEPLVGGHQRVFEAFATATNGQSQVVNSPLAWSSSDETILSSGSSFSLALTGSQQLFNIHPIDGSTGIAVRADIEGAHITGSTEARVFLCENPWPPDMAEDGLPFADATGDGSFTQENVKTNFSTFYCRDRGTAGTIDDLPEIPKRCFNQNEIPNQQYSEAVCATNADCEPWEQCKYIELGYNDPGRTDDRLLKEIFLSVPELNTAIIIQSLTNQENDSVSEWYSRQDDLTSDPKSDPEPIAPLDGFDAIQDRRTIYVGALNDTQGATPSIYNNIYRIVVSDQAPADLIQIFKQMVSNWRFLVNIPDDNQKAALRRDAERIKDAHALARMLDAANPAPALATGSFAPGLSLSVWPSWNASLSSDFGASLPHDPTESIQCDAAAGVVDSQTCRTTTVDPGYACNAGTNAYMYVYRKQGGTASFTANLEYAPPASWNWISGGGWTIAPQMCMDNALQYRKP